MGGEWLCVVSAIVGWKVELTRHQCERPFAVIVYFQLGAFVVALSFRVLFIAISVLHLNPVLAYAIQTIIAVEINFVLNQLLTFRYRRIQPYSTLFHSG